jgi:hypothetical protein
VTEGGGGDLSNYYTKDETDAVISSSTTPIQEQIDDVERVTASALTELHDAILEISGSTGSGPIIPAINTQAEYEAISGDVKSGDLIQVYNVKINGDDNPPVTGLFEADVEEEEYEGVVKKSIYWERKDNMNSVFWSVEDYPWMYANNIRPIDFFESFLVCADVNGEDGAYNGIGFDENGKPIITHFAPEYDDETGEITGITREDTAIGDMSNYYTKDEIGIKEEVVSRALNDLHNDVETLSASTPDMSSYYTSAQTDDAISAATANMVTSTSVSTIVALTQAEYDAITTPDASTLYIIINN